MRNVVIADETAFRELKPTLQEYIEETVDEVVFEDFNKIDFFFRGQVLFVLL
jgi:hypothetical protein